MTIELTQAEIQALLSMITSYAYEEPLDEEEELSRLIKSAETKLAAAI